MEIGHFYFLKNEYFSDFSDHQLMKNHEMVGSRDHNRPCFYSFKDSNTGLYWMIPISSQVKKYEKYYNQKLNKYGSCDTIVFGEVLGHKKAFLIQNMCPIDESYIMNEYIDSKTSAPVRISSLLEAELISKAKKILALQRKGYKIIFPDVLSIEKSLLSRK